MLLEERSAVLNILGGALLGVHNLALVLVAGLLIPVGGNSHILIVTQHACRHTLPSGTV